MKTKICKYCGKEFTPKYKSQLYCSSICKDTNGGIINRKRWEDKYYKNPKHCKQCRTLLPYEKRKNDFCNNSCARSYSNHRRIISEAHRAKTSATLLKTCTTRKIRICTVCGKEYSKSKYNESTNKCCSIECSQYLKDHRRDFMSQNSRNKISLTARNTMSKMGDIRRSKNEIYFCELCENKFQKVTHNDPIFNGWDADVIIHDLKIAVLWNGVWHRKKITRNHSVKQVQNRDMIKIREIEKYGYKPYIIEDNGCYDKEFVEKEFQKFINFTTQS